jgi:hypothetical protein
MKIEQFGQLQAAVVHAFTILPRSGGIQSIHAARTTGPKRRLEAHFDNTPLGLMPRPHTMRAQKSEFVRALAVQLKRL